MNLLAIEQREIPNNSTHKTLWKNDPVSQSLNRKGVEESLTLTTFEDGKRGRKWLIMQKQK